MIRIRKLKPGDMPTFPRRWEVTREADYEFELCDHLMGYFDTWREAMDYVQDRGPRIVVLQ